MSNTLFSRWPKVLFFLLAGVLFQALPTMAAENRQVVEQEAGFYYTIQKGDTLWDLSQHFNNSAWLWPELWEENQQLTNPHWIYPGQRIRLYRRKDAGSIGVNQGAATAAQPLKASPYFLYPAMDSVGFIRKEPLSASGSIFKVKDDIAMISSGDLVYLLPSEGAALNPGSRFTIFRRLNPTEDRETNERLGVQYYLLGVVEITRKEEDFSMGRVISSFRDIKVGDELMPYQRRDPELALQDSTPDLRARVVASEDHLAMMGDHHIAFIDKGELDDVHPGQEYNVFRQETVRISPQKKGTLPPINYGTLMVLHTEPSTATVLITQSERDIMPGALVGTPAE